MPKTKIAKDKKTKIAKDKNKKKKYFQDLYFIMRKYIEIYFSVV